MNPYQDLSEETNDPLADATTPIPGVESQPTQQAQGAQPPQGAFEPTSVAMSGGAYEPYEPPPSQGPSKLVIGIAIAGLSLAGLGIAKSIFFPSKDKPKPKVQATGGYFSEQQKLMREAIDMAKEAQHMQKMHMEEMRRAMEEEAYYAEYGRSGGNDDW